MTGYDIYRNGTLLTTTTGTGTTYSDTSASASKLYSYTVDARDGAGNVLEPEHPAGHGHHAVRSLGTHPGPERPAPRPPR